MRRLNPFSQIRETRPATFGRLCLVLLSLFCGPGSTLAQAETEIFLLPLLWEGDSIAFGLPENLTQNPGYDNQPAFTPDGALLYASTRNGQTDIARLDLASRTHTWLSNTPAGGEYSPLPMPGGDAVSAIRLDTTGLQRLYAYQNGEPRLLFSDLKVGYQVWAGADLLVCTVLVEGGMDLVVARPGSGTFYTFQEGVGRSLQRIPGMEKISYTTPGESGMLLKAMDPVSGGAEELTALPEGVQDLVWLPDGSLLCGGDGVLRRWVPGPDAHWQAVHTFGPGFGQITRLAVNEAGTLLALAVEPNSRP